MVRRMQRDSNGTVCCVCDVMAARVCCQAFGRPEDKRRSKFRAPFPFQCLYIIRNSSHWDVDEAAEMSCGFRAERLNSPNRLH